MQLRIRLFKARIRRERLADLCGQSSLNLTCKKCKAPHRPALFEGDVCKSCYKPGELFKIPPKPLKKNWEQLPDSVLLKADLSKQLVAEGMTRNAFACKIKLHSQVMSYWWTGKLGTVGQNSVNAKIRAGIDLLFNVDDASSFVAAEGVTT